MQCTSIIPTIQIVVNVLMISPRHHSEDVLLRILIAQGTIIAHPLSFYALFGHCEAQRLCNPKLTSSESSSLLLKMLFPLGVRQTMIPGPAKFPKLIILIGLINLCGVGHHH